MRVRFIAPLMAALIAGSIALTAGPASAAPTAPARHRATISATPIDQVVSDPTGTINGTFVGTFTPTRFTTSNGHLVANGLLNGTYTPAAPGSAATTVVNQPTSAPVLAADPPNCTILDLTLGPLHLNLLGLVVDLNQVHLVITAVPGPGNLLGNLLCTVANLLNGGTVGGGLATLLNQLLGLLGGL